jgi:pimeloyl-ACP methyl ester carboxylesterase
LAKAVKWERMAELPLSLTLLAAAALGAGASGEGAGGSPIVFIHGLKGAALADRSGQVHWITRLQGLGIGAPELALPLAAEGMPEQPRDGLVPGAVLEGMRILPWLLEERAYGPFLAAMRASGRAFHPFAYDWRRELSETLALLTARVEQVRAGCGGCAVTLVGHSMGGLLGLAYLQDHPEAVRAAVLAGAPFRGGIGFLPDLQAGRRVGLNSRILSAARLRTFPSVYALFPGATDELADRSGTPIAADLQSPEEWKRLGLGPHAGGGGSAEWESFLRWALTRARAFRERLRPRSLRYPPVHVVRSAAHPTLARAIRDGPQAELGWDFRSAPPVPGDGRVPAENALLPAGMLQEVWETDAQHGQLLSDPAVISRILSLP